LPAEVSVAELIGSYPLKQEGDAIELEVPRAMLAVIRIGLPQ